MKKKVYKKYRVVLVEGTRECKTKEIPKLYPSLSFVADLLFLHSTGTQNRSLPEGEVNKLCYALDNLDKSELPSCLELRTPMNVVVRRWSRVRNWAR